MKIKIKTQTKFRLGQNQDQDEDQDEDQDQVQVIPRPRPGRRPRWERENWIRSRLRAGELCFPPIHWKKVKNAKKFGICTSKNIRLAIFLMLLLNRGEREFPFLSIPKNESLWFPFSNYGDGFFHSLPVPEFWECLFSFPSRSRIMGLVFFHSLPIPELWEWIFFIPFPFLNLLFHRRKSKRQLDYCKRYQASNFFSFLYISQNNYIDPRCSKVSSLMSDWNTGHFAQFCCK